ncbi:hypothetical protein B1H10_06720 [candidate division KSB1 bacterium 4484_188]|nr:MAG: hypothetical protein B1H10_06720 [candidate division KSB1 bacterium 4484_188]
MWQGFINFVLGLWLVISGIIVYLQISTNLIVVGILAAIFGLWGSKNWKGWVIGTLGVWIFLSGIVFRLLSSWNFIISGIVIGILGLWCALARNHRMKPPGDTKDWNVLED